MNVFSSLPAEHYHVFDFQCPLESTLFCCFSFQYCLMWNQFSISEFSTRRTKNEISRLLFDRQGSSICQIKGNSIVHLLCFTNLFQNPLENCLKRPRKQSTMYGLFIQFFFPAPLLFFVQKQSGHDCVLILSVPWDLAFCIYKDVDE